MSSPPPGIEIFVTNIPYGIKEPHIKADLAKVLHKAPFRTQGEPLTNFKFSYGWNKKKDTRGRYGWLTLPNERLGRLFLHYYSTGLKGFIIANQVLRFQPSTRQPPNQLITTLQTTPYADPAEEIEREKQSQDLATRIGIVSIKFGTICRDTVFSAEYGTDTPGGSVSFDTNRRALIISTTHSGIRTFIVCRFPHIRKIWIDEDVRPPESLVELNYPPIFETIPKNTEDETTTRRMSSYNVEHASIAAYCSRSILFTFGNATDLKRFHVQVRKLTKEIPRPLTSSLPMEPRRLYSEQRIQQLSKWLETLPVKIGLQVELAVRNLILDPIEMLSLQSAINYEVRRGREERVGTVMQLLNTQLADEGVSWSSHNEAVKDLEKRFRAGLQQLRQAHRPEKAKLSDPDYFQCHQIYVTPTTIELEGPYIDRSNRILRMYPDHHDHFLRVKFCDEDGSPLYFQRDTDFADFVKERVGGILKRGIDIAGLHFDWLGYSSSALRDHQAWFVAPFRQKTKVVNAARIRDEMGNFEKCIDQPAKYGARLSQAFTATNATIAIPEDQIQHNVDDIEAGAYCFTDGVGELSPDLAREIWKALQKTQKKKKTITPPTAFQGRFGGCKGVWMVNPELRLQGKIIRSRKSMVKFEAPNTRGFEVAATSHRPLKTYLNRPLVKLLEDLGVSVEDLLELQEEAINEIEAAGTSYKNASSLFTTHGLGNSFGVPNLLSHMWQMLKIDFDFSTIQESDFLRSAVILGIGQCLRDIKFRARIPVEGPTLIGVCDIYGILKEGEIYAKCTDKDGDQDALKGRYAITRSPILHPGDVQIVKAVGERPLSCPLRQMYNVVVFSSKGERPLPSYLSGGDLDGDIYNILTDRRLRPKRTYHPGDYEAVAPKRLGRPSIIEDVADFFVDYVVNDQLGRINTLSMNIADFSEKGLTDPDCLLLAQLGSHAVDFPKSGVPVDPRRLPRQPGVKPDFQSDYRHDGVLPEGVYRSEKALGQLFRAVPTEKFTKPPRETAQQVDASALSYALDALKNSSDHLYLKVPSSTDLRQWDSIIEESCFRLQKIAYANTLSWRVNAHLTEEELFIGTIAKPGKFDRAQRETVSRVRTQTAQVARELRREIKTLESDNEESVDDDEGEDEDEERPERLYHRIQRAWSICHAAVQALKSQQPPYGIRIVGFLSLEVLLTLVKAFDAVY